MNRYHKAGERFLLGLAFVLCAATFVGVLQWLGVIR